MDVTLPPAARRLPGAMTIEEFLEWADARPGRWELVEGEPREITPPQRVHGAVLAELARLLGTHLDQHPPDWAVLIRGAIAPEFLAAINMREADMVVTASVGQPGERAIVEPVVLVEVLSPGNQSGTWSNVRAYTSIRSVTEILVVRGDMVGAHVLRRRPDGTWPDEPELVRDTLTLASVEFSVPLSALYRKTPLAD